MCHFEIKKGDNVYTFTFPYSNIPVGELYDVAFDVLKKIQELANEAVDKAKRVDAAITPEVVEPKK